MSMKHKGIKRLLSVVLALTMLVGMCAVPAAAVLNPSFTQPGVLPASAPGGVLDLSGKDIYGDVDINDLVAKYPGLKMVNLRNTNITDYTAAAGVTVMAEDTIATTRSFSTDTTPITYTESMGEIKVADLLAKVKLETANGALDYASYKDILSDNNGTVKFGNEAALTNVKPNGTIAKADFSQLPTGTHIVKLHFEIKDSAKFLEASIRLTVVREYSITSPAGSDGSVYEGGSTDFIFRKHDVVTGESQPLTSADDYDFVLESTPVNNLKITRKTLVGNDLIVTVLPHDFLGKTTSAVLVAYDKDDVGHNDALASLSIVKATNKHLNDIKLKEYYEEADGKKFATGYIDTGTVEVPAVPADPTTPVPTPAVPGTTFSTGPMIYVEGGTDVASKDENNIWPKTLYTGRTMYILADENSQYVPARYKSQFEIEIGAQAQNDVGAEIVETQLPGLTDSVLALVVYSKHVNGSINEALNSTDSTPVKIVLTNQKADPNEGEPELKLEKFVNVSTFGNTVSGYRVYQVPSLYNSLSKADLEAAIHGGDEKIRMVADYKLTYTDDGKAIKDVTAVSVPGAEIPEASTVYFIGTAYYGNGESPRSYIMPDINLIGWYYKNTTAANMFDQTPRAVNIPNGNDENTSFTANVTAGLFPPVPSTYHGDKSLKVYTPAYGTYEPDATFIFGPENVPGYMQFNVHKIRKAVDKYIIAPQGYQPTAGIAEDLLSQTNDAKSNPGIDTLDPQYAGRFDLYNLNELGEDTIGIGATKNYDMFILYNNGAWDRAFKNPVAEGVKFTNSTVNGDDEPLKVNASKTQIFSYEAEMVSELPDSELKGRTVDMTYTNGNISSKTVTLKFTESVINGLYVVYQDHLGNYFSADEGLQGAAGINPMPKDGLEVPKGSAKTKIYVLYGFSNKSFYNGMSESQWKRYIIDHTSSSTASPILINVSTTTGGLGIQKNLSNRSEFITTPTPGQQVTDRQTVNAVINDFNPANNMLSANGVNYVLDAGFTNSYTSVKTDVVIVPPLAESVRSDITGDGTTAPAPIQMGTADNYAEITTTVGPPTEGMTAGEHALTNPTIYLTDGSVLRYTLGAAGKAAWDAGFRGDIEMIINDGNSDITDDSVVTVGDDYDFTVVEYSKTKPILYYLYSLELNGVKYTGEGFNQTDRTEEGTILKDWVFTNGTPPTTNDGFAHSDAYQLTIKTERPDVIGYYLVTDLAKEMGAGSGIYTQKFEAGKTFRLYPVIMDSSVTNDDGYSTWSGTGTWGEGLGNNPLPEFVTKDNVDNKNNTEWNKYLHYINKDDFKTDKANTALPEKLDISLVLPTTGGNPDAKLVQGEMKVDEDTGNVYYEFAMRVETKAGSEQIQFELNLNNPWSGIAADDLESDNALTNDALKKIESKFAHVNLVSPNYGSAKQTLDYYNLIGPDEAYIVDVTVELDSVANSHQTSFKGGNPVRIKGSFDLSTASTGDPVADKYSVTPDYFNFYDGSTRTMTPSGDSSYENGSTNALSWRVITPDTDPAPIVKAFRDSSMGPGEFALIAEQAGDYKIGFYAENLAGLHVPNYGGIQERIVEFTITAKELDDQKVYYGAPEDLLQTNKPSDGVKWVEKGTAKLLDADMLQNGVLEMKSNYTGATGEAVVEVEVLNDKNIPVGAFKVTCIGTQFKSAKLNRENGAGSTLSVANEEIFSLYWETEYESRNGDGHSVFLKEMVDPAKLTAIVPGKNAIDLELDRYSAKVKATEANIALFHVSYVDHDGIAQPTATDIELWLDVSADKAVYDFVISTDANDATKTIDEWSVPADDEITVYLFDGAGRRVSIDYADSMSDSAAKVVSAELDTATGGVDLKALNHGTGNVRIYPAGMGVAELPVTVKNASIVSGVVSNENGTKLNQAVVELENTVTKEIFTAPATNDNGEYSIEIPKGKYNVTVTAIGYAPYTDVLDCLTEETKANFTLEAAPTSKYSVTGYVKDEAGKGLEKADVTLSDNTGELKKTVTDKDGKYTFTAVDNNKSYVVSGFVPGYDEDSVRVIVSTGPVTASDIVLKLAPGRDSYAVYGVVTGENDKPLNKAEVEITNGTNVYTAETNTSGEYRIPGVLEGRYAVIVSADGYESGSDDITVLGGELEHDVKLVKAIARSIKLKVGDNGEAKADKKTAYENETVTITTTPDRDYMIDSVKAADKDGKSVAVEAVKDDETYTFKMPASEVTVSVTFTASGKHNCPTAKYTDLKTTDWHHSFDDFVTEYKLMNGTSDTTFEPETSLSRGMMVQILYNMEGAPEGSPASGFTDVAAGAWYEDAVDWAKANKIVTGMTETTFEPASLLTREQMVRTLYSYSEYKGYDVTGKADLSKFTDESSIQSWAVEAMQWAVEAKIVSGRTDTTLVPQGTSKRCEVAAVITLFCEHYEIYK